MLQPRHPMLLLPMPRPRRSGPVEVRTAASGLDPRAHRIVDLVETRIGRELLGATTRTIVDRERTRIVVDRVETPTVVVPAVMPTTRTVVAEQTTPTIMVARTMLIVVVRTMPIVVAPIMQIAAGERMPTIAVVPMPIIVAERARPTGISQRDPAK